MPSIEIDLEMTDDGIRRELFYRTLKIAIINMITDLKNWMTTAMEDGIILKNKTKHPNGILRADK